jgi:hypothetical protein
VKAKKEKKMIVRTVLGSLAFVGALMLNNCAASGPVASRTTAAEAAAPALDGRAFEVNLAIPGQPETVDGLVFEGGRFQSTECTSYGFPKWTQYKAQRSEGVIAFDVTTKNPSGAIVEWHGTVRDGKISGTAKVTMNGNVSNGTFEGMDTHASARSAKR